MATPYQERKLLDPAMNPGDEPYFEAAAAGRLLVKKCAACGELHHFPRGVCPHCLSDRVEWLEVSGRGTVYTFSVTRRAGPVPYCIAYVTLDEGPTIMTNIVDCDLDDVRIGQKVKAVFRTSPNGTSVPMFAPA